MPVEEAVRSAVAVPSQQEIEQRFHALLPELRSRALAIAAADRLDPDEVLSEVVGFGWYDHQQSAIKGRWLAADQMAWYGRLRVREGHSLGSSRTATDAMSPACRRRKRSRILYISDLDTRRADDPCRRQFDEVIIQGQRDPGEQAITRLDWTALRHQLPGRLRRILDGIASGESNGEIARSLGVSAPRTCQLKGQLRAIISTFFGDSLPASLEGAR